MKGDLLKIAQGTYDVPTPNNGQKDPIYVKNAEACGLQPSPAPTPSSTSIDPTQLVQRAAGYFEMNVDATATALSTDVIWGFGGGIEGGNGAINKQLYSYPANAFAVDTPAFSDAFTQNGTLNASAGSSDYLNSAIFSITPFIVGPIQFTDSASDAGAFAALKNRAWSSESLSVGGNFGLTKNSLDADRCSPCFNSNDNVLQWTLTVPISNITPLTLLVPDGLKGTFRICVKSNGVNYDLIDL